jgi:hypothetical protein
MTAKDLRDMNSYADNKREDRLNAVIGLMDDILTEFGHKEQILLSTERIREMRSLVVDARDGGS